MSATTRQRQIFHSKQALALEDIEEGRTYWLKMNTCQPKLVKVVSSCGLKRGVWMTYVEFVDSGIVMDIYLTDFNVVPYESGVWNRTNWMAWAD